MAILVTGGAGYIGSHTVVELQNAGSVSYTHLQTGVKVDLQFKGRTGNREALQPALDGGTPVSYTHLDVYKRQGWRFPAGNVQGCASGIKESKKCTA